MQLCLTGAHGLWRCSPRFDRNESGGKSKIFLGNDFSGPSVSWSISRNQIAHQKYDQTDCCLWARQPCKEMYRRWVPGDTDAYQHNTVWIKRHVCLVCWPYVWRRPGQIQFRNEALAFVCFCILFGIVPPIWACRPGNRRYCPCWARAFVSRPPSSFLRPWCLFYHHIFCIGWAGARQYVEWQNSGQLPEFEAHENKKKQEEEFFRAAAV